MVMARCRGDDMAHVVWMRGVRVWGWKAGLVASCSRSRSCQLQRLLLPVLQDKTQQDNSVIMSHLIQRHSEL